MTGFPIVLGSERQRKRYQRFLEASVAVTQTKPIDVVTVQDICEFAQATRTTFYSYFGNLEGLFSESWNQQGRATIQKVLDTGNTDPSEHHLLRTAVASLAICNRTSEIAESVTRDPLSFASQAKTESHYTIGECSRIWILAIEIGWIMSAAVLDESNNPSISRQILQTLSHVEENAPAFDGLLSYPEFPPSTFDNSDNSGRVKNAAVHVFVNSGIARSSMIRIARRAGVSTITCYHEFENLVDLAVQTYADFSKAIFKQKSLTLTRSNSMGEGLVTSLFGNLSTNRDSWREFKKEIFLHSQVNKNLQSLLQVQASNSQRSIELYSQLLKLHKPSAIEIHNFLHCLELGLGVLKSVGIKPSINESLFIADHLVQEIHRNS